MAASVRRPRRDCRPRSSAMRSLVPFLVCLPAQAITVTKAGEHHDRADLGFQDIGVDLIPEGFTPRYPFRQDTSLALHTPAHRAKRDGVCGANSHDCLDVGHPERCCGDDTYCYINKNSEPKCCPIGSNCVDDSYCSSQAFFCTSTLAPTGIHTMTVTSAAAPASTPTPTVLQGCCQRACPQTSFYLCASSLGGNCCPFGSDCQAGGNCVSTKTSGVSPRQTLQRGDTCEAGQIRCDDGNGCCDAAAQCTQFQGGAFCVAPTPKANPQSTLSFGPTGTPEGASGGGGGGSSGRTTGLAVGLSLGLSLILGLLAWRLLCLRRRRAASASTDSVQPALAGSEPGAGPSFASDQTPLGIAIPPDMAELPVMHEPNGFDAEPVEIDSTEVSHAAHSSPDPRSAKSEAAISPMSPALLQGERMSAISAAARTTSWPVSLTSPTEP